MCQLFLMRNPYKTCQNCILIKFERTHGRMDGRKDARTSPKQYAPSTFSKVGGKMILPNEKSINDNKSKKDDKDQESIKSSTTHYPFPLHLSPKIVFSGPHFQYQRTCIKSTTELRCK